MNYNINNKLKEISMEEYIWIIYIGIIILSYISNYYEKDFFLNKSIDSKNKYRKIMILIFSVLLIVYLYFFKDAYDSLKKDINILTYLSFIASSMILVSGIIFLIIAISDNNLDVELAFN